MTAGRQAGLAATVAGTDAAGFEAAVAMFRDRLFTTNSWQLRIPDYVVVGTDRAVGKWPPPGGGLDAVVAAGYWGSSWEYRADASFQRC